MKLRDGGCVLARAATLHVARVPIDVVDATGAGDAFPGALAVALLERRPVLDAACFATAASHLTVTGYGSQPAYPTRAQLDDIFQQLVVRSYVVKGWGRRWSVVSSRTPGDG